MSELDPLSERLQRLVAEVGQQVSRSNADAEADALRQRLANAPDESLRGIARNPDEPHPARILALSTVVARHRRDLSQSELLAELLDDPDEALVAEAIRSVAPFDADLTRRLFTLLEDPRRAIWSEAASILARRKDRRLLATLVAWLRRDDLERFEAAIDCLEWLAAPDDYRSLLLDIWNRETRGEANRLILAARLLARGEPVVLPYLVELAETLGPYAPAAAEAIFEHDAEVGLPFLRTILEEAPSDIQLDLAARLESRARRCFPAEPDLVTVARAWLDSIQFGPL